MGKHNQKILWRIKKAFSRQPPRRYRTPEKLKKLAVSALECGHKAQVIAKAAGVSRQSIMNWEAAQIRTAAQVDHAPVQLKLIDRVSTRTVQHECPKVVAPVARIALRSGVIVEIPVAALDAEFVLTLNGGVT